jgi:hypothetical protein
LDLPNTPLVDALVFMLIGFSLGRKMS